jgi:hypothetical protein
MTTTAEGVETEMQREILRGLGCSEMQGYIQSRGSCVKAAAVAFVQSTRRGLIVSAIAHNDEQDGQVVNPGGTEFIPPDVRNTARGAKSVHVQTAFRDRDGMSIMGGYGIPGWANHLVSPWDALWCIGVAARYCRFRTKL